MSNIYQAFKNSENGQASAVAQLIDNLPSVDGVTTSNELAAATSIPPAAPVCKYESVRLSLARKAPVIIGGDADDQVAEEYRTLRTNVLHHPAQPKVIAISSATPGDGKTVTAINFASTLALRAESRVLLIGADLRRSTLATVLGIRQGPGLADVLAGGNTPEGSIVCLEESPSLHVLTSGSESSNPVELLDCERWRRLIATMRAEFDFIVLDTPPVGAVADFKLIQDICDGILLVVRPDHTNRARLKNAIQSEFKSKLLGAVINACSDSLIWRRPNEAYYYHAASARESRSFWRRR